ncbi:protein FAM210B, mitochondrial isoform X2 [Nerophis lumbriciformis]|uniref:protein FAM210B, mitochondrial isoform X2 n=1 Tax=Nerophis lumbriciformis TaxID=546530 RepID=UPI002ADFFB6F|nr:protein FAM210B, mitochondrial isoform X2 [Nerophis lumbriciformis]
MLLRTACVGLQSAGSFPARTLKNVTCALITRTCGRCGVSATSAHRGGQQPEAPRRHPHRDTVHLRRVEPARQPSGGRASSVLRRVDAAALLAGNIRPLSTMASSHAASTATASKRTGDDNNIVEASDDTAKLQSPSESSDQRSTRKQLPTRLDGKTLKDPSTPGKAPRESKPDGDKPNKTQQLKKVFKEYGAVGVSFHIGISLTSLGMFYLLISSGIDMAAVLGKVGFSQAIIQSKMAAGTSTFVLAYAVHKLFAPVRISITLMAVPLIVRYFRRTGLFKPPTSAP